MDTGRVARRGSSKGRLGMGLSGVSTDRLRVESAHTLFRALKPDVEFLPA
jgi:hypothetical protein